VFHITSSIGIPLEIVLDGLTKHKMVIDWKDYFDSSVESGCNLNTIINRIENAVGDCFGPQHREEVMTRLKKFY